MTRRNSRKRPNSTTGGIDTRCLSSATGGSPVTVTPRRSATR
jgi:hypothetical protein